MDDRVFDRAIRVLAMHSTSAQVVGAGDFVALRCLDDRVCAQVTLSLRPYQARELARRLQSAADTAAPRGGA